MSARFGTNGLRAKLDELTPSFILKLGYGFAEFLKKHGKHGEVVVGSDHRKTSDALRTAFVSSLLASGYDVYDAGVCSTPGVAYLKERHQAIGAAIITASHNPPEWNALKLIDWDGIALSADRGNKVLSYATIKKHRVEEWKTLGSLKKSDGVAEHSTAIQRHIKTGVKKKVLGDCGGGTSSLYSQFFAKICRFTPLFNRLDPLFSSRNSEPVPENLSLSLKLVKDYDFGFAWDGDADRLVMVDPKAGFIRGDEVFAFSILRLAEITKVKHVVTTVSTSRLIEVVAKQVGASVIYTPVGSPFISEKIKDLQKHGVCIGGEEVGGVIWPFLSLEKDGIMTAAQLITFFENKSPSEVLAQFPKFVSKKIKIETVKNPREVVEKITPLIKSKYDNTLTLDGVRVDCEEGWVIVRASGTEPCIRIFVEAHSSHWVDEKIKEFKEIVLSTIEKS